MAGTQQRWPQAPRRGAAALLHVPLQPPDEALVGWRIDEHLEGHPFTQLRLMEDEDALDHHYRAGLHERRLLRAVVTRKVVDGPFDGLPCLQEFDVPD